MFADEIRRAIATAPRITLPQVAALLWGAVADGKVTEAEAEALCALIELRRTERSQPTAADGAQEPPGRVRSRTGSRPRTDASLERRRRWVASGRLPPHLAAHFTMGEAAVLAVVAAEAVRRKDCRLAVGHLAAIAGVSETTVRNAVREAVRLGLVTVEERRVTGWRNDTNVIRIVSAEWTAWLRLAKGRREGTIAPLPWEEGRSAGRSSQGRGCKSPQGTPTPSSRPVDSVDRHRRKAAGGQGRRSIGATSG